MIEYLPSDPDSILCGSRTTTGTILTIPAGSTWCGDIMISASVTALGTATPTVTVNGANAAPASGTVVQRLSISGIALTAVTDSNTIAAVIVATDTNVTLDFATGGANSAAVVCNGFTL